MGGFQEMFKKYRLCLILSVMAVVLVVSALLLLKGEEEQPVDVYPESIEVSDVFKAELTDTNPEPVQGSVEETAEAIVKEENIESETVQVDTTEVEQENAVSITETEEVPEREAEAENIPESTAVPKDTKVPEDTKASENPAVQEPVQATVPEQESIPQEEQEVKPPAEEEQEIPSSQEQEKVCAHSWIFESFYQEPTCSNGGLENQVCAHCGETQITGGTPTGKHEFKVETPGDCCSEEVVVCTVCNHREIKEKDTGNHIDVEDGFCYGCGETIK